MEHPLTDNWFVLRDLTRPNAKRPAYRLLEEKGIEVFTPMRWQLVERKGKRIREEVPLLHDLLFAHTTCACMDPIVEEISTLQYRYLRGGYRKPMTVGHAEMNRFIRAVHSYDSPRYFLVEELTPAMYGRMIRIEGGPLDGYEGRLLSIRGARVKRLIVEIPGSKIFSVLEVKASDENSQTIDIILSDNVDASQDLQGLITVDGVNRLNFNVQGNIIRVYSNERDKMQGVVQIKIYKGIKNTFGEK